MEKNQVEGSDGDAAVREIEHWFEEAERMASDEREPGRPGGVDQREVEHVHYLAEHYGRVGTAELGHLIGRRCGKQLTVEQTVYDIAESVSVTFFAFSTNAVIFEAMGELFRTIYFDIDTPKA